MGLRSGYGIFLTSATPVLFYMLSGLFDGDKVFDSVVRVVRQNVFVQQICLAVIGPAFNNLSGQRYAHARPRDELLNRCPV
jgi:hypothetical protein